ncbi:FAD-dependent oxidoreductase [Hymenobacter sp. BT770]|uniref:NAD(P)/FAD-dependent oxidoreductase n=1 Tax=Hymenobacter sp. BT770 TaxID=2886942 RepID=UPI001D121D1E|nr:FAD-dependent oxidoreductase [Hymenobacter sp. BT770]MCC3152468.1 FAD-dependent oxidoreductase [Hymenobacter sp. BT770]MDO3414556.1 FAD-dependent oxidoreductase [Hymenobacter sp. BT770]
MHLVIIGNGITGVTCALAVRRLRPEAQITIVSSESAHHYSRTALMYVYMGHLRPQDIKPYEDWFWAENRLTLVHATATSLHTNENLVTLDNGSTLRYDQLLLATGSESKLADWPGQHLAGVQGFYNLPDLAAMTRDTHGIGRGVVVGGGLIGAELAEMLHSRGIAATVLVRAPHFWGSVLPPEEAQLVDRQFQENHVAVHYGTELREILGDAQGRVRAVVTAAGEEIACQWVGLAIGVTSNLTLAKTSTLETDRGILVDEYLRTSVPNVYAAGDCAQFRQPDAAEVSIEQLWYTGRIQGETVAQTIAGQPTPYRRGVWYNSAKFFNLEYQTYGQAPACSVAGLDSFYWEHPSGRVALRIYFRVEAPHAVVGFNALGLRLRHHVCEQWIQQRAPLETVMAHLGAANFDPEFFPQHEKAIVTAFNQQFPQRVVTLKQKKGLFARF